MNHDQIRERLDEWLDGALPTAESAAASSHIDACGACKEEISRRKRLAGALFDKLRSPGDARSNEAFVARVMARVEADGVSPWERFAARVLAPSFGLALAGLLVTITLPSADPDAALGVEFEVEEEALLEAAP